MIKKYSTLIFFGSLILFLVVVFTGIQMLRRVTTKQQEEIKTLKTAQVIPTSGAQRETAALFSFATAPAPITSSVAFELPVLLNSVGKDVTGFDAVVTYDSVMLTLDTVTRVREGFDIYPKKANGRVTVTGLKQLGNNTPAVFANTPVVKLRFTPKVKGTTTLRIQPTVEKDTSKIVDGASAVTGQDAMEEITLEIK